MLHGMQGWRRRQRPERQCEWLEGMVKTWFPGGAGAELFGYGKGACRR